MDSAACSQLASRAAAAVAMGVACAAATGSTALRTRMSTPVAATIMIARAASCPWRRTAPRRR
eukprot:scaffold3189_cov58-Phaeocystis_antarctica.AAC.1